MTDGKDEDSECTLPPDHPLPADQLGRYSPVRDYYAEKDIANYINGQAPDEEVMNVERIKTEFVLGTPYEMWDVVTDKERWWVITNPTNLYSQRHFPSLDYTLSFHIGLMTRVMSRSRDGGEGFETPFDEVFRRHEQACELLERAIEAVDYQAVGMQLRECLVTLVGTVRRHLSDVEFEERPKDAAVVEWNKLFAHHLLPGARNAELRAYLKAVVEKAWPLVNWLTHHRNAGQSSALVAGDAVETIIKHYVQLLGRERIDRVQQCPNCASRDMRTWYDRAIEPDGAYFEQCAQCSWDNHP